MKKMLRRVKSFITFDLPLQPAYCKLLFSGANQYYRKQYPHWPADSTRKKIISQFWYQHVVGHFAALFVIAALWLLIGNGLNPDKFYFGGLLIGGCIGFTVFAAFMYWPQFYGIFLPNLDMVIAAYENKQRVILETKMQEENQEKCRKAQLSNLALTLLFYIFAETSGFAPPLCNERSARLLMQLSGRNSRGFNKYLELLNLRPAINKKRWGTEIQNDITELQSFMEQLQFPKGEEMLRELTDGLKANMLHR